MTERELLLLERYLFSINFTIPTRAILELKQSVNTWMEYGDCGSIIYGRPRIGKTRAILYITKELKKKYGNELPVFILNATQHTPSDKFFYSQMLKAVGSPECNKGTVLMLKERLLNTLAASAMNTIYKKIVLFIDEAFLLNEKDYIWLMDIYNNLNLLDIQITVFLFGSEELKLLKNSFIARKKHQLVGRFMVEEFQFKGIQNVKDSFVCLLNMDKPLPDFSDGTLILTQLFFPEAFKDGKRLAKCDSMLWDAFERVIIGNNIIDSDIPMKFFITAIIYCLKKFGIFGNAKYFPTEDNWDESVTNCGFINAIKGYEIQPMES